MLSITNYINKEPSIIGGIFLGEIKSNEYTINKIPIYVAYDCTGRETFVEDFDDIVEAAKYANGIIARTLDNQLI